MTYKNYRSHFGVYALILNPQKDQALLIKKALGCYTGLYDLPGGGMEPHELLEETLTREVFEETDCYITSSRQMGTFSILYPFKEGDKDLVLRHLATIYSATVSGTPREESTGEDDSHGCVWIPLKSISAANAAPLVVEAVKHHLKNAA